MKDFFSMKKSDYRAILDRALAFAWAHTDSAGKMVVQQEIDCKDSGWLVLGGVIRGMDGGWRIPSGDLMAMCRAWTLASVRVDDRKSAWTTFAVLYAMEISGGIGGAFYQSFSEEERKEILGFLNRIDMHFLREASKNYRVAAGFIDTLRVRFGIIGKPEEDPEEQIHVMLDAYLGQGFFNDDDSRGDQRDRRIDAYSAEIIGLLLHYDEICNGRSFCHETVLQILRDFCDAADFLIDSHGELAKWGRSLRGEAEVKKIFLFEYARKNGRIPSAKARGITKMLFEFFLKNGISENGQIFKDKNRNRGIWDEYTTHVQAQGYGIYGLAMALRFAEEQEEDGDEPETLFSQKNSFLHYLPGPSILCGNHAPSGLHYILPLGNRMTKNMFFWHNRITGENDVEVDVSAKFMPLPYFGKEIPAPYAGPVIPFLPMILLRDGTLLTPRNLHPGPRPEIGEKTVRIRQEFHYCRAREYQPRIRLVLESILTAEAGALCYEFHFTGEWPEDAKARIAVFHPANPERNIVCNWSGTPVERSVIEAGPSIYRAVTEADAATFGPCSAISMEVRWDHE